MLYNPSLHCDDQLLATSTTVPEVHGGFFQLGKGGISTPHSESMYCMFAFMIRRPQSTVPHH